MKIKVIHNDEAHEAALHDMERLMDADPQPGSQRFEEMELLALVLKNYEEKRHPISPPDPIEAIKFRLEQQGQSRGDLARCLGSRARASEVLNGRRSLSLAMIRTLNQRFGIPAEILIREPAVQNRKRAHRRNVPVKSKRAKR